MAELRNNCPDCNHEMHPIKLIDATDQGLGHGIGHVELSYAAPDAVASQFTRTITKRGTVKAKICPECGRIILHG